MKTSVFTRYLSTCVFASTSLFTECFICHKEVFLLATRRLACSRELKGKHCPHPHWPPLPWFIHQEKIRRKNKTNFTLHLSQCFFQHHKSKSDRFSQMWQRSLNWQPVTLRSRGHKGARSKSTWSTPSSPFSLSSSPNCANTGTYLFHSARYLFWQKLFPRNSGILERPCWWWLCSPLWPPPWRSRQSLPTTPGTWSQICQQLVSSIKTDPEINPRYSHPMVSSKYIDMTGLQFEPIYETWPDAILAKTVSLCFSIFRLVFVCFFFFFIVFFIYNISGDGQAKKIDWKTKSSSAAKSNPLVQITLLSLWSAGLLTNATNKCKCNKYRHKFNKYWCQ